MPQRVFRVLSVIVGAFLFVGSASAQLLPDGTVSGLAKITLRPKPTGLRMQMQLWCYGKSLDAALESLKTRREAATKQLKTLKADAASIAWSIPRTGMPTAMTLTPPTVTTYQVFPSGSPPPPAYTPPTYGNPAEPVEWRPAPVASRPAVKKPPKLFMVSTTLRAEWPLGTDDPDKIAAVAEAICEKAATVGTTGGNGPPKLSPEEQEVAEEAEMARPQVSPSAVAPPTGEHAGPVFVYVARVSDAERKAALASGCAQAKKQAAELAEAAGRGLGEIASLYANFDNSCTPGRSFGPEYDASPLASSDEMECVSASADGITFTCQVTASYRFVPASSKR